MEETNLEVTSHHHLQHQKQLSVGDVTVSVHIVDFERDCVRTSVNREFSAAFPERGRTSQFLFSPSPAAERTQTSDEFLKVYRSSTTVGLINVINCAPGETLRWCFADGNKARGRGGVGIDVLFIKNCNHP